jgi:anti-sigma28 factor (negative regulator of flagellin synthesis)
MSSLTVISTHRNSRRTERESRFRNHQRRPLASRFRKEKVRVIREQLAEGIYDLDEHLDAAVDNLFAVLTGPKMV